MLRLTLPTVALALVLAVPAGAAEKVTDYDRFQLWNSCQPMDLFVSDLHKDADIGLTREAILVAVRSRLRAARLYEADELFSHLYVNVNVVGQAHNISIQYYKHLEDTASGETGYAATWDTGGTGTHRSADYILSGVSQYTDRFIDEYLRVNADSC